VELTLAYGSVGLQVEVPVDRTTVVRPRHRAGVAQPLETIQDALRRPVAGARLRDLARSGQRVAISVCDITRPQPRRLMLEAILAELDASGSRNVFADLVLTATLGPPLDGIA
jgi:nickel-dependent lactate racemase